MRHRTTIGRRFPDTHGARTTPRAEANAPRPNTAFARLSCALLVWQLACTPIQDPSTSGEPNATMAARTSSSQAALDAGRTEDTGARAASMAVRAPVRVAAGSGCSAEGKRACAAEDARAILGCKAGSWQQQSLCKQDEQCTMAQPSADATCIGVAPECLGRAVGKRYCAGDEIRVCGDPEDKPAERCPQSRRCQPSEDAESVECVCPAGSIEHAGVCGAPTDCDVDNGGCDMQTQCTAAASGKPECSKCPDGHIGTGAQGCLPQLRSLLVTGGTLLDAFSPDVYEYRLQLTALAARVTVNALGPDGSHIELNGMQLENGQAWSTLVVPPDVMNIVIVVVSRSGYSSRYQLTVSRDERRDSYIKADHPDADDEFGSGVALYGDTLVVGAMSDDSNGDPADNSVQDSGAVHVYRRNAGKLELQQYLKSEMPTRNDNFGASVAIWEDTIAVGVPCQNALGTTLPGTRGRVEIFVRDGNGWTRQARLESPATEVDRFGYAVALHKDRLVVGAPWDRATATHAGALYVYDRKGTDWGRPSKLTSLSPKANDQLGWAVAVDGDTVVGGAIERDTQSPNTGAAGSAHVFVSGQRGFGEPQQLRAPTMMDGASFGWAVAVRGDTAVIGAPRADLVQNTPAGETFVFERVAGGPFMYASRLQADIPRRMDYFGAAVALEGDLLAVGASGDASASSGPTPDPTNSEVEGAGAVYLFVRVDRMWLRAGYFKSPAADVRDWLGDHIALSEGTVVGTSLEESSNSRGIGGDPTNNDAPGSGAAYVFY